MSQLLHHAHKRLKQEDPEKLRQWNEAMRVLRRGDHYILVLWDVEPSSDHPVRDFFKPFGIGLLIAVGIAIATFVSSTYNVDLDRYKRYFPILLVLMVLLVSGAFPTVYRLLLMRFHRETREAKAPNMDSLSRR
jgi:hypothetical protein